MIDFNFSLCLFASSFSHTPTSDESQRNLLNFVVVVIIVARLNALNFYLSQISIG